MGIIIVLLLFCGICLSIDMIRDGMWWLPILCGAGLILLGLIASINFFTMLIPLFMPLLLRWGVKYLHFKQEQYEKRAQEEERRRKQEMRERAQWERNMSRQIDNLFSVKEHSISQRLIGIYEELDTHEYNEEKLQFIKQELLYQFDEIEKMTLTELSSRDYEGAVTGLEILTTLKPSAPQYKNALERLQDKRLLIYEMEKNGLPESSLLFTQHYANLLS